MPTADLLDFAVLTAPIPGEDPAGATGDFYTVRRLLDDCRTSHDPEQYPQGTPEREQEKRDPNWAKIISESKIQLATKCKHLVYAVRMCEALVMQSSFAGVRDGMKLLKMLLADCWDRLFPLIEEAGDEAARVAQLNWLGEPMSGAFYPTKIRMTPMFGMLSWQSWKDAQGDFEAAVAATPAEKVKTMIEDIEGAQQELRELIAVSEEKVPDEPTELGEVSRALNDCLNLAKQAFTKKGGDTSAGSDEAMADGGVEGGAVAAGPGGVMVSVGANRDSIYESIRRLADALEKLEPHSPVPMYLRKATDMGPMQFHQLVDELTRSSNVLDFIKPQPVE